MTKYIDADALYKRLSVFYNPETGIKAFNAAITLAKELVKNADAADVAEVVRCRECKYYKCHDKNYHLPHGDCTRSGAYVVKVDYCSYGERKMDSEKEDA